MESAKTVMLIVSIMGAAAGVFYASTLKPITNGFLIGTLFALAGILVANLVLLLLYEIYQWYGRLASSEESEGSQPHLQGAEI